MYVLFAPKCELLVNDAIIGSFDTITIGEIDSHLIKLTRKENDSKLQIFCQSKNGKIYRPIILPQNIRQYSKSQNPERKNELCVFYCFFWFVQG